MFPIPNIHQVSVHKFAMGKIVTYHVGKSIRSSLAPPGFLLGPLGMFKIQSPASHRHLWFPKMDGATPSHHPFWYCPSITLWLCQNSY